MNWFVIVAPCSGSWSCNVWSVHTKLDEFSLVVLKSFTRSNHQLSAVATSLRTIFPVSFVCQAWSRTIKLLRKNGLRRKLLVLTWLQLSCRNLRGAKMRIISSPSWWEELWAAGARGVFTFQEFYCRCCWVTVTHLNAPWKRKSFDFVGEHTGSHGRKDRQHMHEKIIEMFCF